MKFEKQLKVLIKNIKKIPDEFWIKTEGNKRAIWFLDREDGTAVSYETSQERLGLTQEGEIIYGYSSGCSCWGGWTREDYCPTISYKEFIIKTFKSFKNTEEDEFENCKNKNEARKTVDIVFAEGWEEESMNNLKDFLLLVDENIDPSQIFEVKNAEIRRYLIKRVGYENIKEMVGAKVIHQDGNSELLEFNNGERYVKVKDSSTEREYLLYVPSQIQRCKQGVAWTFDLEESEYAPLIET